MTASARSRGSHPPENQRGFHLWAADDRLELRGGPGGGAVWIRDAELVRRSARGSDLLRACGARTRPRVLDAMAGWGVDGIVLANQGCAVTLVERHPAVAALAEDLLRRSRVTGANVRWADGFAVLRERDVWDVVYLDPMFPERHKGALPGKRMQWLAALVADDSRPLSEWLSAATAAATDRVVLKRRRKDTAIGRPDWQLVGRTVRYDVYRGSGHRVGADSSCSTA